jgi:mono/diheme cytochrome c family protein
MFRLPQLRQPSPLAALLVAGLALACGSEPGEGAGSAEPPAPVPAAAPAATSPPADLAGARAEAEQIFTSRCSTCHGATGQGDGPASAGLTPPPRNFHDPSWQASVSDDHIRQIIQYGGAAVGRSPAMPANPDLTSKPEVVEGLLGHVRSLGRG